jgi:hypothetical protein
MTHDLKICSTTDDWELTSHSEFQILRGIVQGRSKRKPSLKMPSPTKLKIVRTIERKIV